MPYLQFETTVSPSANERRAFIGAVTELYAEHMDTGTGHIAVTIRDGDNVSLSLGRVDAGDDVLVLNADIRAGRSFDQQRAFIRAAFAEAESRLGVPEEHAYAVVTEHDGQQFHEHDRVLSSWEPGEEEPE